MSGVAMLDFVSQSPEPVGVVCLQKPFRPSELMSAVEAAQRAVRQANGRRCRQTRSGALGPDRRPG
jgi:DNA-binding response OmpR family regulator